MSTLVLNGSCELQMPSSFVDIDREEMEYIDGGDAQLLKKNLMYLYKNYKTFSLAMRMGGIPMSVIYKVAGMSLTQVVALYGPVIGASVGKIGGWIGAAIGAVGGAGAVYYLWNHDITGK